MRRCGPSGLAALLVVALAVAGSVGPADAQTPDVRAFRGLGTWVDVYDYVPGFRSDGGPPPVTAKTVDDMAELGVRTLYLQAAQDDDRIEGATVDPALLRAFVRRAHDNGIRVVAWYLPKFDDLPADLRRIRAIARFRVDGRGFDGIALDLEWTQGVPDPQERNAAAVKLSRQARDAVGERPLGAIALDPVLLEDVNPLYWPDYPWKRLAPSYDVWLPMSYWTNRNESSGYRDGFVYTDENIKRVRKHIDDRDAHVHPIGGIGNQALPEDYTGFVRAARERDAIGWSVYDYGTTVSPSWPSLRGR